MLKFLSQARIESLFLFSSSYLSVQNLILKNHFIQNISNFFSIGASVFFLKNILFENLITYNVIFVFGVGSSLQIEKMFMR